MWRIWLDFTPQNLKPMQSFVSSACGTFPFICEEFNICNKSPARLYHSRTYDGTEHKPLKCMKWVGYWRNLSETHWVLNDDWPVLCLESLWFYVEAPGWTLLSVRCSVSVINYYSANSSRSSQGSDCYWRTFKTDELLFCLLVQRMEISF